MIPDDGKMMVHGYGDYPVVIVVSEVALHNDNSE